MLKQMLNSRAQYAHILVVLATAAATLWAEDAGFRSKVMAELHLAPHWAQGLIALAPFVWALYKQTTKGLAQ